MKIFIYKKFLSDSILNFYSGKFPHHRAWFDDVLNFFLKYETQNPLEADYFFIPLFLLPIHFSNIDIENLINDCEYLSSGRHILFSSGDYGQRVKSKHEGHHDGRAYANIPGWLDDRFVIIALESTIDLKSYDVGIFPYQIDDRRYGMNLNYRDVLKNELLYSFSGALFYPQLNEEHIRGVNGITKKAGVGDDWYIGEASAALEIYGEHWGSNAMMLARSVFTLCPAGFGRWTFRWIEALLQGSIPIVLSDGYVMPFSDFVNWDDYVLRVPESRLNAIDEIIRGIPVEQVSRLRRNIAKDRHLFSRESCLALMEKSLVRNASRVFC